MSPASSNKQITDNNNAALAPSAHAPPREAEPFTRLDSPFLSSWAKSKDL